MSTEDFLLQEVLSYLGDSWLYVGAVNRAWQTSYVAVTKGRRQTSYKVAVSSVTTLRMALGMGLDRLVLKEEEGRPLRYAIAAYGSKQVFVCAKAYGMQYDAHVCSTAAVKGRVDLLKWLQSLECEWANTYLQSVW